MSYLGKCCSPLVVLSFIRTLVEPPQNDPTIIIEQIDRRMYLQQVPLGRGRRAVVDGMCFLHGDLDEKVCLQVDVSSQANPEMIFKMDGENSDVIIAKLPTKIADRIRDILTDIFSMITKIFPCACQEAS